MPNETNTNQTPISDLSKKAPEPAVTPTPEIKTTIKKPKPLVEGINSPRIANDVIKVKAQTSLTPQEKELVSSPTTNPNPQPVVEDFPKPKLMPESIFPSAAKKQHRVGRWLWTGILILALIGILYELYVWNTAKNTLPVPGFYHASSGAQNYYGSYDTSTASTTLNSTATTTPGTTATSTPPAQVNQLKINSTPTGTLNVRNSAGTSGNIITKVHPGDVYTYTKTQNNWYYITLSTGQSGWVSGEYVTLK